MRLLFCLCLLALLATSFAAVVNNKKRKADVDINPSAPKKLEDEDPTASRADLADIDESRGDCISCANRGEVDPSPPNDSFLQLSASSHARRTAFSASALNNLLLHNSAQQRVTLGAKAAAVIARFRALASGAGAPAGMPNLHYLRLWLSQGAVVGANTAGAFKDGNAYAYGGAAPVLPGIPAWGAATTAGHFTQFGAAQVVTHRNWAYSLDIYGRVTQVVGAVRSDDIAAGTKPKGVTRDFVNAIANVAAPAAGFHAGHVRAAAFGGNFDILNFIPEAANVNTGIQCRIESLLAEMTAGIGGPHNLHSTLTIIYTYPGHGAVANNANFYLPSTIEIRAVPLAGGGTPAAMAGWVQGGGGLAHAIHLTFPNA